MPTIEQSIKNLQALKTQLPKLAANEMVNDALDNIKKQQDIYGAPLKKRKPGSKRDQGRAVLVDTGDGRRSLRGVPDGRGAHLEGIDYMIAQNEGVHETVSKRSRKGKSFTVHMNLPQRKFSGDAPSLRDRIDKVVANRIVQALT